MIGYVSGSILSTIYNLGGEGYSDGIFVMRQVSELLLVEPQPPSPGMVDGLFRSVIPHIRSECSQVRDAVITGLGWTSPCSYRLEKLPLMWREDNFHHPQ